MGRGGGLLHLPDYRDADDVLSLMPDASFFIHAQIFDDLLIVANRVTAVFVLKTEDGLILIDAIYPKREMFDAITGAILDIGWNPGKIKKFLLTHGHFDHCGCGKWVKEAFHPETCLSRTDTIYWKEHPFFPDRPETWKDFEIDRYLEDGDEIRLGTAVIQVLATPGHTPGGLSYIFPVHDNGEMHMAGMWGGTNPPYTVEGVVTYMQSLDYFTDQTRRMHCDVILCNHPRLSGFEKIEQARRRYAHMPNDYIIGEAAFQRFCGLYRSFCYDRLLTLADTKRLDGKDNP